MKIDEFLIKIKLLLEVSFALFLIYIFGIFSLLEVKYINIIYYPLFIFPLIINIIFISVLFSILVFLLSFLNLITTDNLNSYVALRKKIIYLIISFALAVLAFFIAFKFPDVDQKIENFLYNYHLFYKLYLIFIRYVIPLIGILLAIKSINNYLKIKNRVL